MNSGVVHSDTTNPGQHGHPQKSSGIIWTSVFAKSLVMAIVCLYKLLAMEQS